MQHTKLLKYILHPARELAAAGDALASVWPSDVGAQQYVEHIVKVYDGPQRHAVQLCATHLAHPKQVASECAGKRQLPITLIQGPPGTGKTHTVLGILNTWHLIQYQRYYDALMQLMKAEAFGQEGASLVSIEGMDELLERLFVAVPGKAQRPRILVCAPSNAATDELLERILREGFRDRGSKVYRPQLLRVGAEEALSEEAKRVWLESQVRGRRGGLCCCCECCQTCCHVCSPLCSRADVCHACCRVLCCMMPRHQRGMHACSSREAASMLSSTI